MSNDTTALLESLKEIQLQFKTIQTLQRQGVGMLTDCDTLGLPLAELCLINKPMLF